MRKIFILSCRTGLCIRVSRHERLVGRLLRHDQVQHRLGICVCGQQMRSANIFKALLQRT